MGERRDADRGSVGGKRGRVGENGRECEPDALFGRGPFWKYSLRFLDRRFSREPTQANKLVWDPHNSWGCKSGIKLTLIPYSRYDLLGLIWIVRSDSTINLRRRTVDDVRTDKGNSLSLEVAPLRRFQRYRRKSRTKSIGYKINSFFFFFFFSFSFSLSHLFFPYFLLGSTQVGLPQFLKTMEGGEPWGALSNSTGWRGLGGAVTSIYPPRRGQKKSKKISFTIFFSKKDLRNGGLTSIDDLMANHRRGGRWHLEAQFKLA